jgi:hypothetical protein
LKREVSSAHRIECAHSRITQSRQQHYETASFWRCVRAEVCEALERPPLGLTLGARQAGPESVVEYGGIVDADQTALASPRLFSIH